MPYGFSGTATSGVRADNFAVQSDGTLWVLYRHGLVEHRDRAGALIGSFTVPTTGITGITAAPDGHLFVGYLNDGVSEYSPTGTIVRTLNVPGASRMSIAPDGDLVTGIMASVHRIERDGTGLRQFGTRGSAPGAFEAIEGVAVAAPGALAAGRPDEDAFVVVDVGNHRVQIIAPDGAPLAVLGAPQTSTLLHPAAAWGTPDGRLLVSDTQHRRIVSYAPSAPSAAAPTPASRSGPKPAPTTRPAARASSSTARCGASAPTARGSRAGRCPTTRAARDSGPRSPWARTARSTPRTRRRRTAGSSRPTRPTARRPAASATRTSTGRSGSRPAPAASSSCSREAA